MFILSGNHSGGVSQSAPLQQGETAAEGCTGHDGGTSTRVGEVSETEAILLLPILSPDRQA